MTCPRCNTVNPAGSVACSACGTAPLPALPPGYVLVADRRGLPTSGMAIAGFVLSFFGGISVLGLIFSVLGYNACRRSQGQLKGEGLALAGIIISIVVTLMSVVLGVVFAYAMNHHPNGAGVR